MQHHNSFSRSHEEDQLPYSSDLNTPKLLLITGSAMNNVGGGTLQFRTLLKNIPSDGLCWAVAGGWSKQIPSWIQGRSRCVCVSPFFHRNIVWGMRHTPLRYLWWWYIYRWFPARAARKIAKFARQEHVCKLWVHATGQVIPVAIRLQRMLGLPIHVSIQDDIEGHIETREANWLRDDFAELLYNATTCDVISNSMRKYYVDKYGTCKDVPVIWIGGGLAPTPSPPSLNRNFRTLGYAGSIWCPDTIRVLLEALDILNAQRAEKNQIKLKVYSGRLQRHFKLKHPHLLYGGLLPPDDMPLVLQDCDLLYVPMSFESRKEVLCRTSIPVKMLTYMQAQVPLFAHGPEYASNVRFVRFHGVGMTSTTTDPAALAESILQYERDYDSRLKTSQRCRELYMNEFNPEQVWERFRKVLFKKTKGQILKFE